MSDFIDDVTVADSDRLFRCIPPWHIVWDNNDKRQRPKSCAFENHDDGLSVSLESVLQENNLNTDFVLRGHDQFALAAVTAGFARQLTQIIQRDPIPPNHPTLSENPAHALVIGEKKESVRRKFAKAATWIVPPLSDVAKEPPAIL